MTTSPSSVPEWWPRFLRATKRLPPREGQEVGCLQWCRYKDKYGYGRFNIDGTIYYAHVAAFYAHNGYWPTKKFTGRTCLRRDCVEGTHIEERDKAFEKEEYGYQAGPKPDPAIAARNDYIQKLWDEEFWTDRKLAREFNQKVARIQQIIYLRRKKCRQQSSSQET